MLNLIWVLALCNYSVSSGHSSAVNLNFADLVAILGGFTSSSGSWVIPRV